ncbi:tRNA 2-thiouridine(34) synthase MnmA [Chromatiales bacterium (ex Bugula neritina AB1)]|nr:tRNA 2-thiouridine(34) synthase MnmA [Chromatiales bacterium (ex Bugula neritina AB1)]
MTQGNSNTVKQQIVIGMSGGVDSSVAAWLLTQRANTSLSALFMQNWEEDEDDYCTAVEDFRDAAGVCTQLNIPLSSVNFSADYWQKVFAEFLEEYNAGRTPNPDILCNKEIKFRAFLDHATRSGASAIATGHYVRTDLDSNGQTRLLRGLDETKDQSYFLHTLDQQQLRQSVFPVGDLRKSDLRDIARDLKLQVHDKKDSTGICFIGERRFRDFLAQYVESKPGPMIDTSGNPVGTHNGIAFYTIGQRQGLGIGGSASHGPEPWYVVEKRPGSNELVVAQGHDHPTLLKKSLFASRIHWIRQEPTSDLKCTAKIRYRQRDTDCTVHLSSSHEGTIEFASSQRAITPGQSVVFYDDEECLGGGIIEYASQ